MGKTTAIFSTTSRRLARGFGAVLLLTTLAACHEATPPGAPPPAAVGVQPVLEKNVQEWDEFNGQIEAVQYVDLRPRVSGYIDQVNYREGQEVKQGAVLFHIDPRTYQAALDQAQAELARARSQATVSRSEAQRAERLARSAAISIELLEQRRADAGVAQANVQAAQAAVEQARLNLGFTQVRAPIDGRTGRALFTAGNLVTAGDAASVLTTLVSQDRYVYFDVDEGNYQRYLQLTRSRQAGAWQGQLPVQAALVGEQGFPHQGQVDFVDNQLVRSNGSIRLRGRLDNRDRSLTPGSFARVRLLGTGESQALLIDERAVLTDQDRKYVYVVDKDGKAQRRDVQLGRWAEGRRVVRGGLAAGDRVVVEGVQKILMPGMPVQATELAGSPGAAADLASAAGR